MTLFYRDPDRAHHIPCEIECVSRLFLTPEWICEKGSNPKEIGLAHMVGSRTCFYQEFARSLGRRGLMLLSPQ